jgi:hypothetical protein
LVDAPGESYCAKCVEAIPHLSYQKTMKKIKMKTHITIIESRRSPDGKQGGGDGKDGLNKSADAMPLSYGKAK